AGEERVGARRPRDGGRRVQGVLAPGREHARGHAARSRGARGRPVPAQRPGSARAALPPRRAQPGRGVRAQAGGGLKPMAMLPDGFSDLERFAHKWCLATERERWAERMSSTMPQMQELYDAVLPRVPDALAYCDKFPLDDMPEDAVHLLQLV